jgi:hypothetical protein
MNIINDYLRKYVSTDNLSVNHQYELYIKEIKKRSLLTKPVFLILIILNSDSLFLDEITSIINNYQRDYIRGFRFSYKIIISSRRGSIYLYETIVNEEIWKKNIRKNHVCVVNAENGTICIKPGHIKNTVYSERLRGLIEEYKNMNDLVFQREIYTLFSLCIENT